MQGQVQYSVLGPSLISTVVTGRQHLVLTPCMGDLTGDRVVRDSFHQFFFPFFVYYLCLHPDSLKGSRVSLKTGLNYFFKYSHLRLYFKPSWLPGTYHICASIDKEASGAPTLASCYVSENGISLEWCSLSWCQDLIIINTAKEIPKEAIMICHLL